MELLAEVMGMREWQPVTGGVVTGWSGGNEGTAASNRGCSY